MRRLAVFSIAVALVTMATSPRPVRTQTSFAVFGCPHVQEGNWNSGGANSYDGGGWTYAEAHEAMLAYVIGLGVESVVVDGDLTIGSDIDALAGTDRFKSWFSSRIPAGVNLWPVAGNHDVVNFNEPTTQGADPYAALEDSFPSLFQSKTYWTRTIGAVRFIALNNNDDYIVPGTTTHAYPEDNPPYATTGSTPNPSFGGIDSRSSTQYRWFKNLLLKPGYVHNLVFAHRGIYAPQDTAVISIRRVYTDMRYKACALACSLGVDVWNSADMHGAWATKRIKSVAGGTETVQPADSLGMHYFGSCGTYARREMDSSFLPTGSLIAMNSAAVDSATHCRWVYVHYFKITGKRIYWRFLRTAEGPSPTYALRVVDVCAPRVFYAN